MKTHLQLSDSSDDMLRRVFSWLSRIGAGPKFGSRPIGWYQVHQCHAIDILRSMGIEEPCCRNGVITDRVRATGKITAWELFDQADKLSRN